MKKIRITEAQLKAIIREGGVGETQATQATQSTKATGSVSVQASDGVEVSVNGSSTGNEVSNNQNSERAVNSVAGQLGIPKKDGEIDSSKLDTTGIASKVVSFLKGLFKEGKCFTKGQLKENRRRRLYKESIGFTKREFKKMKR